MGILRKLILLNPQCKLLYLMGLVLEGFGLFY